MDNDKHMQENMDDLISRLMKTAPESMPADSFTDQLMNRIEHKLIVKEILSEYFWKLLIIIVLLLFVAGVFFIPGFNNYLNMITGLHIAWQLIVFPVVLVLFTLTFDQVMLRYLFMRKTHGNFS
ncbi:MAG: hypothetical protein NTU44_09810 [Bacteroidetes bacterium]|nr:hypothetical protein [Bacteroidota bacterium]